MSVRERECGATGERGCGARPEEEKHGAAAAGEPAAEEKQSAAEEGVSDGSGYTAPWENLANDCFSPSA